MIAKCIDRSKATSDMSRLVRYIMDLKGGISPKNWELTCDYTLDSDIPDANKVAGVRVTNCYTDDPVMATEFILKTQSQNKRSRSDKSYHLVLSFPTGEKPDKAILHEIEDKFCAALGFEDHQRISAIHQDTDNFHVHIAINKVHPETFRNYSPYFDKRTLMKTCHQIEQEYGLIRTFHGLDNEMDSGDLERSNKFKSATPAIQNFEHRTGIQSLSTYVRNITEKFNYTDWQSFHRSLSSHGLVMKKRGNGLVIGTVGIDLWVKASSCDRALSLPSLENRLGSYEAVKEDVQKEGMKNRYNSTPIGKNSQAKERLYSRYKAQKIASNLERKHAYDAFYRQKVDFQRELYNWYAHSSLLLRSTPKLVRMVLRNSLKLQRMLRSKELRGRQAAAKRKLAEIRFPVWRDWLHQQANTGDTDALEVLHSMNTRAASLSSNLLSAKTATKTGFFLRKNLNPYFLKNGNILYNSGDGGSVIDVGNKVHAQKFTTGSAYIALSIAAEKFKNQKLVVDGTDDFKKEVFRLASIHGMNVEFSDSTLSVSKKESQAPRENQNTSRIQEWVEDRNRYSGKSTYVMWAGDESVFSYLGRRKIQDEHVLLFKFQDQIIVKETSLRGFIQASFWDKGEKVRLTKNGQMKRRSRDRELEI